MNITYPFDTAIMALLAVADVDAIILDVLMPKMTGFDLIRLLRRDFRTRHLPILFLSALGEGPDRIKGLRLGANDYLAKPVRRSDLVNILRKYCA